MDDWIEELRQVGDLRDKGILTDEEFEAAKKKILDDRNSETSAEVPADPESTIFDIYITDAGPMKINVIKEIRGLTSLGLKEAKEIVESVPALVLAGVSKEVVDLAKRALESAGASISIFGVD
tara:strand:- start:180 stop:548 length:369 start_codon:yes stop_codon:yes gene_type:complete